MQSSGRNERKTLQSWMAFLTSCLVHLTFALAMALVILSGTGGTQATIQLSMDSAALDVESVDVTSFEPVSFAEPKEVQQTDLAFPVPSQLIAFDALEPIEFVQNSPPRLVRGDQDVSRAVAMGASDTVEGENNPSPSKAKFFGVPLAGSKFVFVIDSSGSMEGPRWVSLCNELIRCIKSLSPDQEFFVISFDSQPHPMFGKAPPEGKFLLAGEGSVRRIRSWLRSITLGSSTLPAASIGMAMQLEPDAILLLSDGEIMDNSIEQLRVYNRRKKTDGTDQVRIPIHTFLLHSYVGYKTLETIAEENDGVFTPINLLNQR